ncbi:NDR1/HIN1-like protein 1 [Linum grandiflorum]
MSDSFAPYDTESSSSPAKKIGIIAIATLIILFVVIMCLVFRPSKPTFHLQDTTLNAFTITESNRLLTISLQVTLSSRNPSRHVGIEYVRMGTYLSYRGQDITMHVELPQGYLGTKESLEWSPFLSGESVLFSPEMAALVGQDLNTGVLQVELKVYGKIRWKVGTMVTRQKHMDVNCPAYLTAPGGIVGGMVNGSSGIGGMVYGDGRVWSQFANQGVAVIVAVILLFTWLIVNDGAWPEFEIKDATFYDFNLTESPNGRLLLTTSLQVNISSSNPNLYRGIDYVSIGTHASYRGQKITLPAELPRTYSRANETVEWSAVLSGESVEMANLVGRDLSDGVFPVDLEVYVKLRWKSGVLFSYKHRLHARCPVTYVTASGGGGRVWYGPSDNHFCKFV